jgi:hypothetical protein
VPSLPKLLELHRAKEHQLELLAALERALVLVAPGERPALEAEIVCTTREIDRLVKVIREQQAPDPSVPESEDTAPAVEEKTKPVVH